MKNLFVFAALFLASCSYGYSQVDLHNGLKGYYPFTGNAKDMSGNAHDATVTNATLTTDRSGASNSAYYFNGTDASVSSVDFSTASFTAMSFSAWIKSDKTSPQSTVIQHGGGVMYTNIFTSKRLMTTFNGTSGDNSQSDVSTSDVVTGEWVHVVATNDGSTTKLYVNGQLETTYSETYLAASNGLFIGSQVNGMWGFQGSIDEVYIYNRAINADEVSALYNGGLSGIKESKNEQQMSLYPNPATGRQVMLKTDRTMNAGMVSIYTPEGREVLKSTLVPTETAQYKLNFGGLPAGVYIVFIRSGEAVLTKRIVLL